MFLCSWIISKQGGQYDFPVETIKGRLNMANIACLSSYLFIPCCLATYMLQHECILKLLI